MADLQSAHRSFVGTACLYRDLAHRPKPFLQRNLNHVLHAHARDLAASKLPRTDDFRRASHPTPKPYRHPWDSPPPEIMTELKKSRQLVLRIDAFQLRRVAGDDGVWRMSEAPPPPRDVEPEFDFLPATHQQSDMTWNCVVHVSILNGKANMHTRQAVLTQQVVKGTISQCTNANDAPVFEVALDTPFYSKVDSLLIANAASAAGSGTNQKQIIDKPYTLEIVLKLPDVEQAREVISRIEGRDIGPSTDPKDVHMKMLWTKLPECPPAGHLIPIKRSRGHKSIELKYGMDISMGWSRRRASPIAQYNRLRAAAATHQLPTPSTSDLSEHSHDQSKPVRYIFREGLHARVSEVSDLRCVFCGLNHVGSSLLHLRHHYVVNHDYFHFELQKASAGGSPIDIFLMSRTEYTAHAPAIDGARTKTGYGRVAPDEPYDMAAHLDGDDSWTRSGVVEAPELERPAKRMAIERTKSHKGSVSPQKQQARTEVIGNAKRIQNAPPIAHPSIANMLLNEIVELPDSHTRKRSHQLPKMADGVEFYHLISRQPIQPEDRLDRSDDELEDHRLAPSQRQTFKSMGMSEAQTAFHQAFNLYLDCEQPESTVLVRGAVLRFARKHYKQLRNAEWRAAFCERVTHLREHCILTQEIEDYCLRKLSECAAPATDAGGLAEDGPERTHEDAVEDVAGTQNILPADQVLGRAPSDSPRKRKREQDGTAPSRIRASSSTKASSETLTAATDLRPDRPNTASRSSSANFSQSNTLNTHIDPDAAKRISQSGGNPSPINEDVEMRKDSPTSLHPPIPPNPQKKKIPRECICGIRTEDDLIPRKCVICENSSCPRGTFHMACVGVTIRSLDWRCTDCAV